MISETALDLMVEFLEKHYRDEVALYVQGDAEAFEIDYADLRRFYGKEPDTANQADRFLEEPDAVLELIEEGLDMLDLPVPHDWSDETIRVVNIHSTRETAAYDLGAFYPKDVAGGFAAIRGQVSKITQPDEKIQVAAFECQRCGTMTRIPQTDEFREPRECQGCEREGPFRIEPEDSETVNHQQLQLKTPPERAQQTQADLNIELAGGDLLDRAAPGDRIAVNGTIERRQNEDKGPFFDHYVDGHSIDLINSDLSDIDIEEHEERIEEIASSDDVHQQIIDSIAPTHYGDEHVKAAIACQIFGGVEKELADGSSKRGTIHVLEIGDPGTGKSDLLSYAKDLVPRSIKTSGSGSTSAGLTCAAVQDEFGDGGWSLQAGALVKGNNGLTAIDELDDMAEEDRAGMLEAMSDQQISVSKAGINAELPAATSVLAAANPKYGRFDPYEPTAEQLDLDPALISRFDLIYTMKDTVDADEDAEKGEHVNEIVEAGQRRARDENPDTDRDEPEIDPEVMQAYVSKARDIIPVLNGAAKERILDEYLKIRSANDGEDGGPVPTTMRNLLAMHRLAEASARMRLSETIEIEDAERAINMIWRSLEDVGIDPESGNLDADVIETGSSKSQRDRVKSVKSVLLSLSEEHSRGIPEEDVYSHPVLEEYDQSKIEHTITKLKDKGEVYSPQDGKLELT
jgi:replicative DNA helicase Mcm